MHSLDFEGLIVECQANAGRIKHMSKEPSYTITESELQAHADNYDGICMSCGTWTDGGVEPDASGYACEECGKARVVGAEFAMIAGGLTFVAEDTEAL